MTDTATERYFERILLNLRAELAVTACNKKCKGCRLVKNTTCRQTTPPKQH